MATQTQTQNPIDVAIHTRALLVWLNLRSWSGHKYDKGITQKVNRDLHASTDAGRYNKHLMKDSTELKAVNSLIGSIRQAHYAQTLAWSDDGWRILTTANYMAYTGLVRTWQHDIDQAVDALVRNWHYGLDRDRVRLNGAFDSSDYPSSLDVRAKFGLSLSYMPLPIDDDVRVNLADDAVDLIKQSVLDRFHESINVAVTDSWQRLFDSVSRIHERLSDPDNIFRNTLIDNARETCDVLGRLNLTNDPAFDAMRERVQRELCRYDAQALRNGKRLREATADRASAILQAMRDNGFVPAEGVNS